MPLYDFREEPNFTRHIPELFGTDENYSAFQAVLNQNPRKGDVIQGTGGLRKVRYRDTGRGMGTRGGLRIIYLFAEAYDVILLVLGYNKNIPDLTPAQKQVVKKLAEDFVAQLALERELAARKRG